MKSESVRADLLKNVSDEYNRLHPSAPIKFTPKQVATFAKCGSFGLPLQVMGKWLDLKADERDKALDPKNNPKSGIPINMNDDANNPNEFQMWVRAAYNSMNTELQQSMVKGNGIAIKADQTTPYSKIEVVMDNLQTMKMNKFTLMTALKKEE
jgi:biopolymer transport protein ExbD